MVAARRTDDVLELTVRGPTVSSDARHGDSIAVSGVCLTVTALGAPGAGDGGAFRVELVPETLARTSLAGVGVGTRVNLAIGPCRRRHFSVLRRLHLASIRAVGCVRTSSSHGRATTFAGGAAGSLVHDPPLHARPTSSTLRSSSYLRRQPYTWKAVPRAPPPPPPTSSRRRAVATSYSANPITSPRRSRQHERIALVGMSCRVVDAAGDEAAQSREGRASPLAEHRAPVLPKTFEDDPVFRPTSGSRTAWSASTWVPTTRAGSW